MRIVIATGIYPPEIGGPAYYAQSLERALRAKGEHVAVITYGRLKKLPIGIRHLAYLFRLLPSLYRTDVVLALDTFSVGVPAALACRIVGIPLVIRTGGDFLWEQHVERVRERITLPDFYTTPRILSRKERMIFTLTRWALRQASVVFSTAFQRDIWVSAYGITGEVHIIANAVEGRLGPIAPERKVFLALGRDIFLKNEVALREAFWLAQQKVPDIELETGFVSHHEFVEKVRRCHAVVVASVSDISPNAILDAVRCSKPFMLTKYSGFADTFSACGVICDPLSTTDMAARIVELCDPARYRDFSSHAAAYPLERTYEDLAEDFITLFDSLKD